MKKLIKKTKVLYIATFFIMILFFSSCDADEPTQATKLSISQIKASPDFYWFEQEYENYKLDIKYIDSIKYFSPISNATLDIIIFTTPSCLCGTDYLLFPKLIKILDSINIDFINYINYDIYMMNSITNEHIYDHLFNITTLPSFAVLKNNVFVGIWDNTLLIDYQSVEQCFWEIYKSIQTN